MQKALQYLKRQILVPGLHIRKSQISDCCFWVHLPVEQIIVNGLFFCHTFHHHFYILKCAYFE